MRANIPMLNVLIIDDDSDIRFGVNRILSRSGHSVLEAESGEAALECLAEKPIDLVFCDLRFPTNLSGTDILAAITADYPQVKVVMMSCAMEYDIQASLILKGASAALQKPFFKAECADVIAKLFPPLQQAA